MKPSSPLLARVLGFFGLNPDQQNYAPRPRLNRPFVMQDARRFYLPGNPEIIAQDPLSGYTAALRYRVSEGHEQINENPGASSGGGSYIYGDEYIIAPAQIDAGIPPFEERDPASSFRAFRDIATGNGAWGNALFPTDFAATNPAGGYPESPSDANTGGAGGSSYVEPLPIPSPSPGPSPTPTPAPPSGSNDGPCYDWMAGSCPLNPGNRPR